RLVHGWHTPSSKLSDKNAAVQSVLAAYLVGPTSPLHQELVLEKQLAESIGTRLYDHRDPQLFSIPATGKEGKDLQQVGTAFDAAVQELVDGHVDAKRVDEIKSNLRYALPMGLETAEQVAEALAVYAGVYGAPDALELHYQNLVKVAPEDLTTFAKNY